MADRQGKIVLSSIIVLLVGLFVVVITYFTVGVHTHSHDSNSDDKLQLGDGTYDSISPRKHHTHKHHSTRLRHHKKRLNTRPVIGIVTQDCYPEWQKTRCANGTKGYVAASYVKWIEGSGARVLIVPLALKDEALLKLLKHHLSGLVLPGGADTTPKYKNRIKKVLEWAVKRQMNVPVWGTCLGFEELGIDSKMTIKPIEGAAMVGLPLAFYKKGRLFKNIPASLQKIAETKNITYNGHHWALLKGATDKTHWVTLTTSRSTTGVEFISSMEHKTLAIYGTQWHPEKPAYYWNHAGRLGPIHTLEAVELAQFVGNFFVQEARKHKNRYRLSSKYLSSNTKAVFDPRAKHFLEYYIL